MKNLEMVGTSVGPKVAIKPVATMLLKKRKEGQERRSYSFPSQTLASISQNHSNSGETTDR